MMKKLLYLLLIVFAGLENSLAQQVYTHISQKNVYDFLDELTAKKIIQYNSCIKPLSRKQILFLLSDTAIEEAKLTKRMRKEWTFYRNDFSKEFTSVTQRNKRIDAFFYKDSLFTFTINPIIGYQIFTNDIDNAYHRWNGAEVYGNIGKHFGYYANLRDNRESIRLATENYLTLRTGAKYKPDGRAGEYSEMRGGITYDFNWGVVGLIKDHLVWGNAYQSSVILSGRTPSFTQILFKAKPTKWLEFNYFHGWLSSEILDSLRTYQYAYGKRKIYREKYLAANMVSVTPWKYWTISLGNSIVYADIPVHPAYLIPILFYKSIDHTLNAVSNSAGQNAQMFGDISIRQIKNVHIYSSLFIDELSISNMWDKEKHSNWFAWKCGTEITLIPNVILHAEYTRNNPIVYKHFIPTTTYRSSQFLLGNYLGDNAEEQFFSLVYKPIRGLRAEVAYTMAKKGTDYERTVSALNTRGLPFLDSLIWKNEATKFSLQYELFRNVYAFASYEMINPSGNVVKYMPILFRKKTNTISGGLCIGF